MSVYIFFSLPLRRLSGRKEGALLYCYPNLLHCQHLQKRTKEFHFWQKIQELGSKHFFCPTGKPTKWTWLWCHCTHCTCVLYTWFNESFGVMLLNNEQFIASHVSRHVTKKRISITIWFFSYYYLIRWLSLMGKKTYAFIMRHRRLLSAWVITIL